MTVHPAAPAGRRLGARPRALIVAALVLLGAAAPVRAGPAPISPVACAGVSCAEPRGADHTVDDLDGLRRALRDARGGEVIALAPGVHGFLALTRAQFEAPVTVRSADPENPARLSGLALNDVENLALEGLVFDYRFAPGDTTRRTLPFAVRGGRDVSVRHSMFSGDVASGTGRPEDDGLPMATGLSGRGTRGLTVEGNLFARFWRAGTFGQMSDLAFVGNRVEGMRSEGLNVVEVDGVLIEDNHFAAFQTSINSGDHPDMIQFWTTGTERPTRDVVIRGNLMDASGGRATHAILMGNQAVDRGAGREMFFQNVVVEDNVIAAAHLHGISMGQAEGVRVRRNTLVRVAEAAPAGFPRSVSVPTIRVHRDSVDVVVEDNVTGPTRNRRRGGRVGPVSGHVGQPDWRVSGNVLAQDADPGAPGWYGDLFVDALGPDRSVEGLRYRPDGPLAASAAGAGRLRVEPGSDVVVPLLRAERTGRAPNHFAFDAGLTMAPGGLLGDLSGADVEWRLPGGETAAGLRVTRALAPGRHVVRAVIRLDGAGEAEGSIPVTVPSPEAARVVRDGPMPLGGQEALVRVDLSPLAGAWGAGEALVRFRFRAEGRTPDGRLLELTSGVTLGLTPLGGLEARIGAGGRGGTVTRTGPLGLNRGGWHEVALRLSADGRVSLVVDGAERARADGPPMSGTLPELALGHRDPARAAEGEVVDLLVETTPAEFLPPGTP